MTLAKVKELKIETQRGIERMERIIATTPCPLCFASAMGLMRVYRSHLNTICELERRLECRAGIGEVKA